MGDRLRVLVADDNEMMREFLRKSLTHLGHEVFVVGDGGALVGACRTMKPDIVVSDVDMPELDGIAAAGVIHRWSPVPIVLISANWNDETRAQAANAGATRCETKPVRPLDLVASLEAARAAVRPAPAAPDLVQSFVETLGEYAVFTLDEGGHVTSWNHGAAMWLGYSEAEIRGRSWEVCLPREEWSEDILGAARDRRVERSCWWVTRDGVRTRASVVIAAVRDPDGRVCGYGAIVRAAETGAVVPAVDRIHVGRVY